jgi:hypothetical protein
MKPERTTLKVLGATVQALGDNTQVPEVPFLKANFEMFPSLSINV